MKYKTPYKYDEEFEHKFNEIMFKLVFAVVVFILFFLFGNHVREVHMVDPVGISQGQYLEQGQFELIDFCREDSATTYEVLMDKETGVLYLRYSYGNQCGMTVLYNADDTVMTMPVG